MHRLAAIFVLNPNFRSIFKTMHLTVVACRNDAAVSCFLISFLHCSSTKIMWLKILTFLGKICLWIGEIWLLSSLDSWALPAVTLLLFLVHLTQLSVLTYVYLTCIIYIMVYMQVRVSWTVNRTCLHANDPSSVTLFEGLISEIYCIVKLVLILKACAMFGQYTIA